MKLVVVTDTSTKGYYGTPSSVGNLKFQYSVRINKLEDDVKVGDKIVYWNYGSSDGASQEVRGVLISTDSITPLRGWRDTGIHSGHPPILKPYGVKVNKYDIVVEYARGSDPTQIDIARAYDYIGSGEAPYPYFQRLWNQNKK
jgi:hypothetical protein